MRELIIPDAHHKIEHYDRILKEAGPVDQVYCTGDLLDDFLDDLKTTQKTTMFIQYRLNQGDKICLGNHEAQYLWGHIAGMPKGPWMGWSPEKEKIILNVLGKSGYRQEFKLHYWLSNGALLTHAGLHNHLGHPVKGWSRQYVDHICQKAFNDLEARQMPGLLRAGNKDVDYDLHDGGAGPNGSSFGGLTWLRWSEFEAIEGLDQVVGHTPHTHVQTITAEFSTNYCLDTNLQDYMVIQDGKVEIHHCGEGKKKVA